MGLLDFKKYHHATHISRLIDCYCHENNKDCVKLETSNNLQNLVYFPWTLNSKLPKTLKQLPLIKTTLDIFHKIASMQTYRDLLYRSPKTLTFHQVRIKKKYPNLNTAEPS